MREYQQQKRIKRRIFSKLSILILAVILFFIIKSTYNVFQKDRESAANLARVAANLQNTEERYKSLAKETDRLKTNEGIEEEIRHNFPVSKEGEKVIVVIDDKTSTTTATTTPSLFSRFKYAILSLIGKK